MSKLVRITITLPRDVLAAADREAKRLDRSRSRVVAEALRRYVGEPRTGSEAPVVREAGPVPYSAGLGEQRLAQLEADLALTPEQRVREAERTARAGPRRRRAGHQLQFFDRYEDYLEWKRSEAARG